MKKFFLLLIIVFGICNVVYATETSGEENDIDNNVESYEEDLVLLCAAMMVDKEEDFINILRMVQMKPEIMELMEGLVKEMNHDEKLVTEYKIWKNEEERINASRMDEAYKTGIEEGAKQTRKELVLDMYNDNVSLELISKYTKLNENEHFNDPKLKKIMQNLSPGIKSEIA